MNNKARVLIKRTRP